jgi:hypothetical protein
MNRSLKRIVLDTKDVLNDPIDNIFYYVEEANMYKGYALIVVQTGRHMKRGFIFLNFSFPTIILLAHLK